YAGIVYVASEGVFAGGEESDDAAVDTYTTNGAAFDSDQCSYHGYEKPGPDCCRPGSIDLESPHRERTGCFSLFFAGLGDQHGEGRFATDGNGEGGSGGSGSTKL